MAKDTCGECKFFETEACNLKPRKPKDEACDEFYRKRKRKEKAKEKKKRKPRYKDSGLSDEGYFEAIYHNDKPAFLIKDSEGFTISETVTCNGKVFQPKDVKRIPYMPYGYFRGKVPSREALFWKIRDEFHTFIDVESIWQDVLSACVLLSYQQEKLLTVPYIYVYGDNESGKSTVLQLLNFLCYRPMYGVTVPAADIYGYLDDIDSIGCVLEDEVQGIHKDIDKIKIYKAGYKQGAVVPRTILTQYDRIIKYYNTFCFKACASEQIPHVKGFRERFIEIAMVEGFPQKEWTDITKEDLCRLYDLRNMLLKWRMLSREWQLPNPDLSLRGRLKEIWKPILQITYGLPIYDTLANFVEEQRRERLSSKQNTLEGHIVKVVAQQLYKGKDEAITFGEIWEALLKDLEGVLDSNKTYVMHTPEFDDVTKNKIGYRLREILNGKRITLRTQQGNVKAYKFDERKLARMAKKYGYTLHTKLPSEPSSEGIKASNSTLKLHEKNVEKRVDTPQQLGALGYSVCKLVAIEPHVDRCAHCQRIEVLHWQVETFKGEWGHVCNDCYPIFSEVLEKRREPQ